MFPKPERSSPYQKQINVLLEEMRSTAVGSDEYGVLLERLQKLHKMQVEVQPDRVSPDTLLLVAANLIGIAAIIRHEQFNVITSRAMNFVLKPR